MSGQPPSHPKAVLQALLVTVLWSTSWVLIKIGLVDIPALTFAGLRYVLAFVCLLPFALRPARLSGLRRLSRGDWGQLILLGFLFYTVTQGSQFVALSYLPATTVSLMLSFTAVLVALLGAVLLSEKPTALQWAGIILYLVGVMAYFYPAPLGGGAAIGYAAAIAGVLANALSSVLGRRVNRRGDIEPLTVTAVSMGVGSVSLLAAGALTEGLPHLSLTAWTIIAWLAVVNTAFAFTLWNHTLRTLSAMESNILNNTMLIQIAILAWVFLDERPTWQAVGGLALAAAGTLLVQLRRRGAVTAELAESAEPSP